MNPAIFKAYDVRGIYPSELDEAAARLIGRAFVAYLGRRGSPSRATCACRRRVLPPRSSTGATEQGADVVDYGMAGTDMLYFAVVRDGLDGGAQVTASHNPEGIQRHEDGPARGVPALGRRRHRRDSRHGRRRLHSGPARAAAAGSRRAPLLDDYVEKVMSFIDPSVIKPFNVVLDAGSGMAGLVAPQALRPTPLPDDAALLRDRRHVPEPRGQSAHRGEPARHRRARRRRRRRHRHRLGRRRRPVFLHRRRRRVHRRRLHHGAPGRSGPPQAAGGEGHLRRAGQLRGQGHRGAHGGTALMNRVGHAFIKRRMREENAIFGGEVTGHYYFRDFYYADNGFIPALLILELMSQKGQTLSRTAGAAPREVLHLRRDQHADGRHVARGRRASSELAARYARRPHLHARRLLGRVPGLALQRPRLQHRADAAPEPRGADTPISWSRSATKSSTLIRA